MSAAKLGSEQCLPLRGKQPHERVCAANWRRSLCAAKRPRTPAGVNDCCFRHRGFGGTPEFQIGAEGAGVKREQ